MKFRDPKKAEVFYSIEAARSLYCDKVRYCTNCAFGSHNRCIDFCKAHPAEAARQMGFEVVEERDGASRNEKEANMEKMSKPRICEVLGVEEFERICEAVHNGWWDEKKRQGVTDHPDMIPYGELAEDVKEYDRVTVRRVLDALGVRYESKPRFTAEEVAVLRHFAASGVIKIKKGQNGGTMNWDADREGGSMSIPDGFLPSLRPGQSVKLEDIINAADR